MTSHFDKLKSRTTLEHNLHSAWFTWFTWYISYSSLYNIINHKQIKKIQWVDIKHYKSIGGVSGSPFAIIPKLLETNSIMHAYTASMSNEF